jgi:formylglycine-generating enzyme required for sulfatase activity
VDGADLGLLLGAWGTCPGIPDWATVVQYAPDPTVVTDPALRAAIIATGRPWRVRDTVTQIEMLLVPPGTFQMGCIMGSNWHECDSWEQPVHQVTLTNAFYLGRYEVTQAQWQARMGSNPSAFRSASTQVPAAQVPNRPVEQVSWNTIQGFLGATGMRLPTEAEWEYACRAGTQTPFYNGSTDDNTLGALAWHFANSGNQTRPVGGKAANAFGFHDMLGNVKEWVNDWYGGYSAGAQTDPTGPVSASFRVRRGGSWLSGDRFVRSSFRFDDPPGDAVDSGGGFRVARTP